MAPLHRRGCFFGAVRESGSHAALVRKRGLYARLARAQDLDMAPEAAPQEMDAR